MIGCLNMHSILSRDGKRAPHIYKEQFLLNDLYRAATSCSPKDFACFHLKSLKNHIGCEFLTVNVLDISVIGQPDSLIASAIANVDKACITSYANHLQHDCFTPTLFMYPGSTVFADAQRPMDEWFEQNIYKLHCNLFSFYWTAVITYQCAYRQRLRLAFYYINPKKNFLHRRLPSQNLISSMCLSRSS